MTEVELAIVGSDPFAAVLAGVLAHRHGKRVLLIAAPSGLQRLPRNAYASFGFATRPESWALRQALVQEGSDLIASIGGRQALWRVSPPVICHNRADTDAMAHMMHVARYFGLEIEAEATGLNPGPGGTFRVRGEQFVRTGRLWSRLPDWLERGGVTVRADDGVVIEAQPDGSATVRTGDGEVRADRVVLADDEAIAQHVPADEISRHFDRLRATSVLTEPVRSPLPLVFEPGRRLCAWQQSAGTLMVLADVPSAEMGDALAANLNLPEAPRRAGQGSFERLVPRDGAAMVGQLGNSGLIALAGLGQLGLHLAPSLARVLTGTAGDAEASYWRDREPGRNRNCQAIVDYRGSRPAETAA